MKQNKDNSNSIFTDEAFDVSIETFVKGQKDTSKWLLADKTSELGCQTLTGFFNLIRVAALSYNYVQNVEDVFGNVLSVLFKKFNLGELDKQGHLGGSIKDYIQKLEEYNYYLPNELVELSDDKENLKSNLKRLEFNIGYEGDLDSVVDCFRTMLISLRGEKVEFWKRILEEYNRDKEAYDLEFRTKYRRYKKDLELVSKIDIDDYVKRFKQVGKKGEN